MSSLNISIRELSIDDTCENNLIWMNDLELNKYLESRWQKHTLESIKKFVQDCYYSNNNYLFGIFDKENHIGNIKIGPIDFINKKASIGLIIGDKNYWGKGVGTKAISLVIDYAFNILNLNKITAGMYKDNVSSYNIFRKNGFNKVGCYKEHCLLKENIYTDVYILELLRKDYFENKE